MVTFFLQHSFALNVVGIWFCFLLKEMFPWTYILKRSLAQSLCGSLAASAARYSLAVAVIIKAACYCQS